MPTPHPDYTLTSLLPTSSYTLAYALPLFFISFVLTFAGAFLSLDRTRAFAPRYDALPPPTGPKRGGVSLGRIFRLEGGLGGLGAGYVFGLHFATFLALLIPNVSSTPPLNPKAFIAVWLLPAIASAFLAARWKWLMLFLAGVAGYATLALSIAIIVHPSLLPRLVLVAIFTPLGTIACLLPIARFQHVFVRVAMSSVGSFGLVVSIALLAHISAWADVWGRLWVKDGAGWGTPHEKGLSAAYCLFLFAGAAVDWFLKSKFGENPDQKWDSYLADYAANLPSARDRAGSFQPLQSFWARHFRSHGKDPVARDIIFPADADLKMPIPDSPLKLYKRNSLAKSSLLSRDPTSAEFADAPSFQASPEYLRKDRKRKPTFKGARGGRGTIKFEPLDELSDSDSDDEDLKKPHGFIRAPTRTDSMATLTNEMPVLKKHRNSSKDVLAEEDVTSDSRWNPHFLKHAASRGFSQHTAGSDSSRTLTAAPPPFAPVPIPATPSLIKAVDRIQAAYGSAPQTEGLPTNAAEHPPLPASPPPAQWGSFWKEVKGKAGHDTTTNAK